MVELMREGAKLKDVRQQSIDLLEGNGKASGGGGKSFDPARPSGGSKSAPVVGSVTVSLECAAALREIDFLLREHGSARKALAAT